MPTENGRDARFHPHTYLLVKVISRIFLNICEGGFMPPSIKKKKKKDFPDFLIPLDSPRTLWQGWKGHFCWLWTSTCINTQIPNLGLRDASLQPPSCSGNSLCVLSHSCVTWKLLCCFVQLSFKLTYSVHELSFQKHSEHSEWLFVCVCLPKR